MRLSLFITQNMESILQEWEDFARTKDIPGKPMDPEALRDHARLMLQAIAVDIETRQSDQQQIDKSQGKSPDMDTETPAEFHAITRLMSGFTLDQMVSEYRALRASVLRQWTVKVSVGSEFEISDIMRFNEAVDQALGESIASYNQGAKASRDIFLGILGHDLRTPLGAILLASEVLLRTNDLSSRATKLSSRIFSSVKRASRIVEDLLDFTRSHLGHGIPVTRTQTDLVPVCEQIVDETCTYYPEADIDLVTVEAAPGLFDIHRIEQVFSNLISNAVQHGDRQSPISVTLTSTEVEIIFSVHNEGVPIPEDALPFIFSPMARYAHKAATEHTTAHGLGLGLHIASEIVAAHEGHIEVRSDLTGTTFIVHLPQSLKAV
jgi:signal transduction histidine kinase